MTKEEVLDCLKRHLQTAIELEHSTLPPYLCAYWSIHGSSANAEHVKKFILSVVQEEMLHMAMACNILNAIGGHPVLNNASLLPCYPCMLPGHSKTNHSFLVHLNKCCPQSVSNFIQIELPEAVLAEKHHEDGWCTIGEFYDEVEYLLNSEELDDSDFRFGRQLEASYNPGKGKLYTVSNRQEALNALEEIIDQGEGHSGKMYDKDHELTHYWRFHAIRDLMENDLWNYKDEVVDMAADPDERYFTGEAKQLNRQFNIAYSELLDSMHEAFNSESPSLDNAIGLMFKLKKPAQYLMQIPLQGKDGNAGPTFNYIAKAERA